MAKSNHEISLTVSAKDKTSKILSGIGGKFSAMAKKVAKIFATIGGTLAATGAAVGAFATKMVQAYTVQETAEMKLMTAHRLNGEAANELIIVEREMASAMQNELGVGDEVTLGRMAQLRTMGIMTSKLQEAATAVASLTALGMSEQQALRGIGNAYHGNYQALQRYIPAIRAATTAEEKQKALDDALAIGQETLKQGLNTVAGSYSALQGRIGDAKEAIGQAIVENTGMVAIIQSLDAWVVKVTNDFIAWAKGGGIQTIIANFQTFGANVMFICQSTGITILNWANTGVKYLGMPFIYVGNIIGNFANAVWSGIEYCIDGVQYLVGKVTGEKVPPPDFNMVTESVKQFGESFVNGGGEMMDDWVKACEEKTEDYNDWYTQVENEYLRKIEDIRKGHNAKMGELIEENHQAEIDAERAKENQLAKMVDEENERQRQQGYKEMEEAEKARQDELAKAREHGKELLKQKEEINQQIKEAEKKLLEDINKLKDEDLEDNMKKTREREREEQRRHKKYERERKKAETLRKRIEDGQNIGTRNARWLAEFNKREEKMQNANEKLRTMKDALKDTEEKLEKVNDTLKKNGESLEELLKAG